MNLLKALAKVGSMTFVSRILGFVRDTLIARVFGAGMLSDAFIVAFKIPNLLRRISAEGAFSQAFVPILAEYKSQRSFDETHGLVNRVATWLGIILVAVTLLGPLMLVPINSSPARYGSTSPLGPRRVERDPPNKGPAA